MAGRMRNPLGWVILLVVALAVGGCSDKKSPPRKAPKKAATAKKVDLQAQVIKQEAAIASTYIYSPVGKRDPFRSLYKEKVGKRKDDKILSPLQQYEIDQLKLIAVITGVSNPRAMVVVPGGKGYTVKVGTRIGKNYGHVVRIKNKEVIIAEDYRDWNGRKVTNYIHMALKQEDEKD